MSIEVILFLIIGSVSVLSALMMLISKEAVHSALYLILNFACIAILFLMLDAPFLAMVQIAVYAGAIMVLFLFVIMLLGADKAREELRQFKTVFAGGGVLALGLMLMLGAFFISAGTDDIQPIPENPQVRVLNALTSFPSADFYLLNEAGDVVATFEGVQFGTPEEVPPFVSVEPGTYILRVANAGEDRSLPVTSQTPLTLEADQDVTIVAYGTLGAAMLALPEDMSYLEGNTGRLALVNTTETPLALIDVGSDFELNDENELETAEVILPNLAPGDVFVAEYRADTPYWAFVETTPEGELTDRIVLRLRGFVIHGGRSNLLVVGTERGVENTLYPVAIKFVTPLNPAAGSPEQIGASLFVDYVLPFELVALLLLAAMVGAIVLTQRSGVKPKPGRPTRRKVSRPLTSVIATQTGQQDVIGEPAQLNEPAGD
ncbi:MAG: hypothetical protein CUN56_04505 [Phototrophicales bacterium]|nr:MAG: hypothetical protein CUN56_04505 [Phototrophicales bacterium]RMG75831.1 MAG: DUF4397 domain-containing protein [Chloroflexota bacterium]